MSPFDPDKKLSSHLKGLDPYIPGSQPQTDGWTKLNTNELAYPASPRVHEAIVKEIEKITLYPDPRSSKLREAIEKHENLPKGSVIIGNGSDDILNLLARLFGGLEQDVAQTFPSYSLYPILVAISGGQLTSIEFDENFHLPTDELISQNASLLYLTSPNAPTGVAFSQHVLEQLAENFDGVLVVDEAYVDFADWNARSLLVENENVVITRTFSKSYGLAGLRVGYAMASPEIVRLLDGIRDSYNVNRLSQAGALAAYEDRDYYQNLITKIKATRERFKSELESRGWKVYPSATNFLFGRPVNASGESGSSVAQSLFDYFLDRKILVRHFKNHPLTAPYLRISIGTDSQIDNVLEEIDTWKKHAPQK